MEDRKTKVKFIIIEVCNYVDHPPGGQLNFARLLLRTYGDKVATVGYPNTSDDPIGKWFEKADASGAIRDHFNMGPVQTAETKYFFPRRLRGLIDYIRYSGKIHEHPCKHFFVQEHALMIGLRKSLVSSVCYRFPGVESQLAKSRFKWAIPLTRLFDFIFYRATRKADILLASADEEAVEEMRSKSFGYVDKRDVHFFPTRVDTEVFKKKSNFKRSGSIRFISCGRLHWVKGWRLILEALASLKHDLDFRYTYVGDGPDREEFLHAVDELGMADRVELTGFLGPGGIAQRLQHSDLYLMGSVMEGWPTTLVEAYVVGLPMVTTSVSGARMIVEEGRNGYVCASRSVDDFLACIRRALELDPQEVANFNQPGQYGLVGLRRDLAKHWRFAKIA